VARSTTSRASLISRGRGRARRWGTARVIAQVELGLGMQGMDKIARTPSRSVIRTSRTMASPSRWEPTPRPSAAVTKVRDAPLAVLINTCCRSQSRGMTPRYRTWPDCQSVPGAAASYKSLKDGVLSEQLCSSSACTRPAVLDERGTQSTTRRRAKRGADRPRHHGCASRRLDGEVGDGEAFCFGAW
jgi:hypothetical protein